MGRETHRHLGERGDGATALHPVVVHLEDAVRRACDIKLGELLAQFPLALDALGDGLHPTHLVAVFLVIAASARSGN
jgi:hypothetical protein